MTNSSTILARHVFAMFLNQHTVVAFVEIFSSSVQTIEHNCFDSSGRTGLLISHKKESKHRGDIRKKPSSLCFNPRLSIVYLLNSKEEEMEKTEAFLQVQLVSSLLSCNATTVGTTSSLQEPSRLSVPN
ncbi:hypothetical protein HPP92_008797 [Vanilla planifolia]|uniref:Uncharacterized protein n=1 Tax=Vanilla planifolia TaxID=51239 RepID=A0A835RIP0_VANPL|nr:hypothetical protein HPP92_008797 [Vanilla planifolia]